MVTYWVYICTWHSCSCCRHCILASRLHWQWCYICSGPYIAPAACCQSQGWWVQYSHHDDTCTVGTPVRCLGWQRWWRSSRQSHIRQSPGEVLPPHWSTCWQSWCLQWGNRTMDRDLYWIINPEKTKRLFQFSDNLWHYSLHCHFDNI